MAMRGLCPASALSPVSHSPRTEVQSHCRFPPVPRAPAAQVGRLCLGREWPVPREGVLRERESQERRGPSGQAVGLTAMAWSLHTTGQVVVYTVGFLGLFGSPSVIYVCICNVAGFWRMFILIVCQTSTSMLPVSCRCCNCGYLSLYVPICINV